MSLYTAQMRSWSARRWLTALVVACATVLVVAIPTDMLSNPYFTRSMPVTWWSYPVLIVTAIFSGLLVATYVASPVMPSAPSKSSGRFGSIGVLATYFAVGCPICNKLVVLALGVSGAMAWFAPIQPALALASLVMLAWAFRTRLQGLAACPVLSPSGESSAFDPEPEIESSPPA
jgi:hypothetical protein